MEAESDIYDCFVLELHLTFSTSFLSRDAICTVVRYMLSCVSVHPSVARHNGHISRVLSKRNKLGYTLHDFLML